MAHAAPVDQERQWYDFFGITAVALAGIVVVRSVFEWRIFHRKKKRHDHSS